MSLQAAECAISSGCPHSSRTPRRSATLDRRPAAASPTAGLTGPGPSGMIDPNESRLRDDSRGGTMSESLPEVYLARHGETAWTISRKHTGGTDIPLTEQGERNARSLCERLRGSDVREGLHQPDAARSADLRAGRVRPAGRGGCRPDGMGLRRISRDSRRPRSASVGPIGTSSATDAPGASRSRPSPRGPTASSRGCAPSRVGRSCSATAISSGYWRHAGSGCRPVTAGSS